MDEVVDLLPRNALDESFDVIATIQQTRSTPVINLAVKDASLAQSLRDTGDEVEDLCSKLPVTSP